MARVAGRDGAALPAAMDEMTLAADARRPGRALPGVRGGPAAATAGRSHRTGPPPVSGAAGIGAVARDHSRPGPAGLPGRELHPMRSVHDRLPLRAHLLECAHLRQAPRREAHRPTGPAFSPSTSTRSTATPRAIRPPRRDGAGGTADGRPDLRRLRRHRYHAPRARLVGLSSTGPCTSRSPCSSWSRRSRGIRSAIRAPSATSP